LSHTRFKTSHHGRKEDRRNLVRCSVSSKNDRAAGRASPHASGCTTKGTKKELPLSSSNDLSLVRTIRKRDLSSGGGLCGVTPLQNETRSALKEGRTGQSLGQKAGGQEAPALHNLTNPEVQDQGHGSPEQLLQLESKEDSLIFRILISSLKIQTRKRTNFGANFETKKRMKAVRFEKMGERRRSDKRLQPKSKTKDRPRKIRTVYLNDFCHS
jgi:hypothetical protein